MFVYVIFNFMYIGRSGTLQLLAAELDDKATAPAADDEVVSVYVCVRVCMCVFVYL